MSTHANTLIYPHLLTKEQASRFLGIDTRTFDKYIRPHDELGRFMLGRHERYTIKSLIKFVEKHSI